VAEEKRLCGDGDVEVKDGRIILSAGSRPDGLTCTRTFRKTNYEISLEAMRVNGSDFFCGLTFRRAVAVQLYRRWLGWRSRRAVEQIDGSDASETKPPSIRNSRAAAGTRSASAWTNDNPSLDRQKENGRRALKDKTISIRIEVEVSRPLESRRLPLPPRCGISGSARFSPDELNYSPLRPAIFLNKIVSFARSLGRHQRHNDCTIQ